MDARTAIGPPTRGMDLPNLHFELTVSVAVPLSGRVRHAD